MTTFHGGLGVLYIVITYIVMTYIVMADMVSVTDSGNAVDIPRLCSCGIYSYYLPSYGVHSHGLHGQCNGLGRCSGHSTAM